MKSKQEVIQEAWGENWDLLFDSEREHALQNDGWIPNIGLKLLNKITFDFKKMHIIFGSPEQWLRPQSLAGIETNNGWTIADVTKLPTEGIYNVGYFLDNGAFLYDEVEWHELREYVAELGFTHYQTIIKPEAPIY